MILFLGNIFKVFGLVLLLECNINIEGGVFVRDKYLYDGKEKRYLFCKVK